MWSFIWGIIKAIFGFGGDSNVAERAAGEKLGVAETADTTTKTELNDAQKSVDAGNAAASNDDAGGVREPHIGDKPWNPDAIG